MTEIYLIRHAEAEGNLCRRIHGHYDSLITPNGYRQIQALEKRFASIPVDACYASDLTRTSLTATAIFKPKNLPLLRDRRFREIFLGQWEDLPFGELHRIAPESIREFNQNPAHWWTEGAEHFTEYTDRFLQAMQEAVSQNEGKTIVIVSHGCAIRGVQLRLFFDPEHPTLQHCDNTAVSHLFYEDGHYCRDYLNDNSHLSEEISTLARQHWWRVNGQEKDFNLWYRPIEALHESERGTAFCAMLEDTPVGTVAICEESADTACIRTLYLKPEFRRRGFGPQLLGQAISCARRMGKSLLLARTAPEDIQSQRFYRTSGFVQTDEHSCCYMKNIDPAQFHWEAVLPKVL